MHPLNLRGRECAVPVFGSFSLPSSVIEITYYLELKYDLDFNGQSIENGSELTYSKKNLAFHT